MIISSKNEKQLRIWFKKIKMEIVYGNANTNELIKIFNEDIIKKFQSYHKNIKIT